MWIKLKETLRVNTESYETMEMDGGFIELLRKGSTQIVFRHSDPHRVQIVYDAIWKDMVFGAYTFDLVNFLDTIDWSLHGVMAEAGTRDMPF